MYLLRLFTEEERYNSGNMYMLAQVSIFEQSCPITVAIILAEDFFKYGKQAMTKEKTRSWIGLRRSSGSSVFFNKFKNNGW